MTMRWGGGRSALLLAALLPAACMKSIDLSHPPVGPDGEGGGGGSDGRLGNGGNGNIDSGASDASRVHCNGGAQTFSLDVTAEIPAVMFALDRSPSMKMTLGTGSNGATRFSVTRQSIIDTMNNYPNLAQFGYVEFPSDDSSCSNTACCAGGLVPLVQGDTSFIVSQLNRCTQGNSIACTSSDATPTEQALKKITQSFKNSSAGPVDVILLTDGPPSQNCADSSSPGDACTPTVQQISDMATGRLTPARIRTFVVAVGDVTLDDPTTTPPTNKCLSMMAGVSGHASGPPFFYYVANTEALVRSQIDSFVSGLICHLDITDPRPFDQSPGRIEVDVTINNQNTSQVPNDSLNGWTLAGGGTRLDFAGSGCSTLISGLLKGLSHHVTIKACPADSRTTPFPQPNP